MKGVEYLVPPLGPKMEVEPIATILGVTIEIIIVLPPTTEGGAYTLEVLVAILTLLTLAIGKK